MWHHLDAVADSRKIDRGRFSAFVTLCHSNKLDEQGMIHTWDVDEVVNSFHEMVLPVDNIKV